MSKVRIHLLHRGGVLCDTSIHSHPEGPQGMVGGVKTHAPLTAILGIAVAAGLIILYATTIGPWVMSDSVEYLQVARNVLAGHGFTIAEASGEYAPVTLHPPLYSLWMALASSLGLDLLGTARWSGAILITGTTILLGLGTLAIGANGLAAVGVSLAFAFSATIVSIHAGVLSEPLFFMLCFAGIFACVAYISTRRPTWLLASGLLLAFATLDRFVGVAAVGSACLAILLIGPGRAWHRIVDAAYIALIALLPLAGWRLAIGVAMPVGGRVPPDLSPWRLWSSLGPLRIALVHAAWSWNAFALLMPDPPYRSALFALLIAFLALALAVVTVVGRARRRHPVEWRKLPQVSVLLLIWLFAIGYVLFFTMSYLTIGPGINIEERQLSPLWVAVMLGSITTTSLFFLESKSRVLTWSASVVATLIFAVPAVIPTPGLVSRMHDSGDGYSSLYWQQSELVRQVATLPKDMALITNESAAILYLVGRPAYDMREIVSPEVRYVSQRYGDDVSDPTQVLFRDGKAALVLFDTAYWQLMPKYNGRTGDRLKALLRGLRVWSNASDGGIYVYP